MARRIVADAALGLLAEWVAAHRAEERVRLVGLDPHAARLLQAFGIAGGEEAAAHPDN